MRIKNLRTRETDGTITFLADCKIRPYTWDTVYFTFDKKYKDALFFDGGPLAAAFLIPAMCAGEDLVIEGPVSEQLYAGMNALMDTIADWDWEIKMKRINIKVDGLIKDIAHPTHVATFFSGGVDSFYTFLKHREDAIEKIDHFILIKGNDIEPGNDALWEETFSRVKLIAEKSSVELVVVECNFQSLIEPMIDQGFTHGGLLAAVGLFMRGHFKKIYIPATFSYAQDIKWGSHPDIDHLWGSEVITFEHDGAEATRFEKIAKQIIHSPLALEELRVCYMNVKGKYNCGHCEKCYRTMLELYALGKLDEATTFPHEFDLGYVEEIARNSGPLFISYEEIVTALEEKRLNLPLQEALKRGLVRNDRAHIGNHGEFARTLIRIDHLYLHGFLRASYRKIK